MKRITIFALLVWSFASNAQLVTTSPVIFTADQSVTITFDATQGNAGLAGASSVFMHAGVILNSPTGTGWSNVIGQWGSPTSPGQMTSLGNNKWQITITPRTYFNVTAAVPIFRLGMVFREAGPCGGFGGVSTDCKKGGVAPNAGDVFLEVSQGGFDIALTQPTQFPIFKNPGESIMISGNATIASALSIKINGVVVASQASATSITTNHVIGETGIVTVLFSATDGGVTKERTFNYIVRTANQTQPRPAGVVDGINYNQSDAAKATLSFLAPLKSSVYLVGDFNDWKIDPAYQMKKDGDRYWLELNALTSGTEYAYQYLVDEILYTADPFCDKILDPNNDQFISSAIYPSLKPYPVGKASGIVSVLQTGQMHYTWQVPVFNRPAKSDLIIYELLVRDFDTAGSFQNVIDRLDYLKTLGINAIELMPIMEFSGNDSWGYNPIFYLAPDKAYGTKNKLKELIDKAHQKGMAVILDMVLNQADYEFPYAKMYFSGTSPTANNPWFNQTATHPFSVFFDFNHEAQVTKDLVDRINSYWLTEYKFDGFRFDLSKGFTQKVSADVNSWNQYDQSRVNILTRMANVIWSVDPSAYVILEHLGIDDEERVLVNSGMMVWGIMQEAYKQSSLGFSSNSDISRTYFKNRSGTWNQNGVVAYMESHDEERIMYYNQQFGSSASSYNIKNNSIGLERIKAVNAMLLSIPGPKMIWQFGELGYDFSINLGGRTSPKPIRWDYFNDKERRKVYDLISTLNALKNSLSVFKTTDVSISGGTDLVKQIVLKNQPFTTNPTSINDLNVVLVGNFDVVNRAATVSFPHTGIWFHYFSGGDILSVTSNPTNVALQPGEFRIYTDFKLSAPKVELVAYSKPIVPILNSVSFVDKSIKIDWTDNSTIETGYTVYRRKQGDSFVVVSLLAPNTTSVIDGFSQESTTKYEYYVEANNPYANASSQILSITTPELITGLEDSISNDIELFPNPANDIITIKLKQPLSESGIHVTLIDLLGCRISMKKVDSDSFDISQLPPGIYVVRIQSEHLDQILKLIKK